MKPDSMTLLEAHAIFELLEVTGGSSTVTEIQAHVAGVKGRGFNSRSIRRTVLFFHCVRKREEVGDPIEPTEEVTKELANFIKYGTSEHWVESRLMWYSQWRRERAERARQETARLERLLDSMWVPEFDELDPFMLRRDGKMRARNLDGKPFKWLAADKDSPKEDSVIRCWFSDEEDQWLRHMLVTAAPKADRERIIASYDQLQQSVTRYISVAGNQRTSEQLGDKPTVKEVYEAFLGGSTKTHHDRFEELLGLTLDPPDLRGAVISFTDEVRFVVGL